MRLLWLLIWAVCAFAAHAYPPTAGACGANSTLVTTEWRYQTSSGSEWVGGFTDLTAACQAYITYRNELPGDPWHYVFSSVTEHAEFGQCFAQALSDASNTDGGTDVLGNIDKEAIAGGNCQCNSGYTDNGTACVPESGSCAAGGAGSPVPGGGSMSRTVNLTVGWARTPVIGGPMAIDPDGPDPGDTVCSGGCEYVLGNTSGCYRSQDQNPANSMYRLSCDYTATATGQSCTVASDAPSSPDAPEPPCSGEIIEVPNSGGRTLCVIFPGGVPDEPPEVGPEQMGNPAAGNQPSTGPGSGSGPGGRTPVSGEGGNEGGGSGSAVPSTDYAGPGGGGGGGSGTGDVITCGLPDTPKCKIDETGTPTGEGAFDGVGGQVDGAASTHEGVISGWGSNTGNKPEWTWAFALPTGCNALTLTGFGLSVNVCQFQAPIHDLLSLCWIVATIFGCTALVFRTINAG